MAAIAAEEAEVAFPAESLSVRSSVLIVCIVR